MIRNIKALGLAFLALAAVGALSASAAQADVLGWPVHITTEKDKAVITAQTTAGTNHTLTIGATSIPCKNATLEGTVSQGTHNTQLTATRIEATATYSECTGFGGIAVTVQMHGCKYTITATQTKLTALFGITGCTKEKQITIKSSACTVFIGNQEADLSHITLTNDAKSETTEHHIQDHVTVSGIKYTTNKQFLCPQAATLEYKGTTTIKAYEDAGTEEVLLHEHKYIKHLCGKEVGILAT
jgi:hypothetical protein